jgi:5'-nucleotidase
MKKIAIRTGTGSTLALLGALALLSCVSGPPLGREIDAGGMIRQSSPYNELPVAADQGEDPALRRIAEQRLFWKQKRTPDGDDSTALLHVKVLAINDFHGQLSAGKTVGNRPVGSAPVLAAYLASAGKGMERRTIIVHAGDHVGASPPASALLQDEPSIGFLNMLVNRHCSQKHHGAGDLFAGPGDPMPSGGQYAVRTPIDPRCNLVATVGNHEFDEGRAEMLRLIYGGDHPLGPFLEDPYQGARFPYVVANVVDTQIGKPILPPYDVKEVEGIPIGFIGAVLKETPSIVTADGIAGLAFLDEADSINRYVRELQAMQVRSIIVLLHQGSSQTDVPPMNGPDAGLRGAVVDIVNRLDDEVDAVISGHAHSYTNTIVKNAGGAEILVTQAFSAGTAYSDMDLQVDRATKDIMGKSAAVITTYADAGPGLEPDPRVAALVAAAEKKVAPLVTRVIGTVAQDITRGQTAAGESALGNLIADAQRAACDADIAFVNPGGIRADLRSGQVTRGILFAVQPFRNTLVRIKLTGQQIFDLLNQQWALPEAPRFLQVSGLTYAWDNAVPADDRVIAVKKDGMPIDRNKTYTVVVNDFLAGGGDGFTVLRRGTDREPGPVDIDALIGYLESMPHPISASVDGRIERRN